MSARTMMSFTCGVAAGAGAEYLLDPDRGHARRTRLSAMMRGRSRKMMRLATRRLHYVRGVLTGRMQARRSFPMPPADDYELVQKIRSEILGRLEYRDLDVIVDSCDGIVHLRGAVADSHRAKALHMAVAGVDGVRAIENFLHAPGAAAPNKVEALRSSSRAARLVPHRVTAR